MLQAYLDWPLQIEKAIANWGSYTLNAEFDEVVVIGMGGSGIVGDYLNSLSGDSCTIPIHALKSYLIPGFVGERSLVVAVSYSGDTIETLLAFKKAFERRAKIVALSSGGKLKEMAIKYNVPHIALPSGLLPRASLPIMLYTALGLLDSSGHTIVSKNTAAESLAFLRGSLPVALQISTEIAQWINESVVVGRRLLVIASHTPLEALAIRGKNELNENSKLITKVDVAPEWMHNDIVGYESSFPLELSVIEVVDPDNSIGRKLVEFMESVYLNSGARLFRLGLKGRNILEKIMFGSIIWGLASVSLAELRTLDPSSTKSIYMYKERAHEIYFESSL
ncbi:MAG: bifunctional phosphoglucose/phosphomannose isomerase [Desulfurococcaceae archaeon]